MPGLQVHTRHDVSGDLGDAHVEVHLVLRRRDEPHGVREGGGNIQSGEVEWMVRLLRLSALGELDYFADFPRPFFRIRAAGGLQLKGVEGWCRLQSSVRTSGKL